MPLAKRIVILMLLLIAAGVLLAQDAPPPQDLPPAAEPVAQQFDLPITENVGYVVQPRDTLDEIGALFDVSIDCLRSVNGLRPVDILYSDTVLTISVDCPNYVGGRFVEVPRVVVAAQSADGSSTYIVQVADTLDTIGQRLNVSAQAIQQANNISNPKALAVGQILTIPADAPPYGQTPAGRVLYDAPATAQGAAPAIPSLRGFSAQTVTGGQEYVVQLGDTLDTIGQEFDVSVVTLQEVNNLAKGDRIFPGNVLLIPDGAPAYGQFPALGGTGDDFSAQAADGTLYVVQPGDTLDTIARELNVSADAIALASGLAAPGRLQPGLTLVIPLDAPPYGVAAGSGAPAGGVIADGDVYVIQIGDTLDVIAAEYNVDLACLVERNQIASARSIRPGQVIGIPADCPAYSGFSTAPSAPAGGGSDAGTDDSGAAG